MNDSPSSPRVEPQADPHPESRPAHDPASSAPSAKTAPGPYGSAATQFRYLLKALLRSRGIMFWTAAFPILLATLFSFMFAGITTAYQQGIVDVAVVDNAAYQAADAQGVREAVTALAKEGDDRLISVTEVSDQAAAQQLIDDGDVQAAISADDSGSPVLAISPSASSSVDLSILQIALSRSVQVSEAVTILAQENPAAFASPDAAARIVEAFTGTQAATQERTVLHSASDASVRYYYALLGFLTLQSTLFALTALAETRANGTPQGMRRQLGGLSSNRTLAAALAAAFVCTFACALVGFAYMRFALGVEFGGRDGLAVLAIAACALTGTGLGALIGCLPLSVGAKSGLSSAITCGLSLFAGLYGQPAMQLADWMSMHLPVLQVINPAVQAATVFYDLAYYDSLAPFFTTVGVLVLMAVACFGLAAVIGRRRRYEAL